MKIIIPGGSGQVGQMLVRAFQRRGDECVVLTRQRTGTSPQPDGVRTMAWDGKTLGPWASEIDGADVVINLAGRSVDCRYDARNLAAMMSSRVDSTRIVGVAIAAAKNPPRVWLQASTATIYAHRFDAPNDEATGEIGGNEPGVPALWAKSIAIAQAWEAELSAAQTPHTRKVALRSAMTMSPDRGGVFSVLARLCRLGVGRQGDGRQFVSWIHADDFVAAVDFLIAREDLEGAFNLCAPEPLPNQDFMNALSSALRTKIALPVPRWPLEIGAFFLRTETELVLKSRRVVPTRLLKAGFAFRYPHWPEAAKNLADRIATSVESTTDSVRN
ncbi:MAG: TIGR01777 family oxidoreductase [Lacunisphaera sp.]